MFFCKSYFSFHYGTFATEELVKAAVEFGISTLALTNINNTCDAWDFVDFCGQQNIKPVLGAEIRNGHTFLYTLLARNNKGLSEINRHLSEHLQAKKEFPLRSFFSEHIIVIYPLGSFDAGELLPNEFIGVQISEVNKLFRQNFRSFPEKFLVRHPVTFQNKTYYNVHRLMRAVGENIILSKQLVQDIAGQHETFVPITKILETFQMYPAIITNTMRLLDSCSIEFEFHTDKTKKIFSASAKDDRKLLEKLAFDGLRHRYDPDNTNARARLIKELQVINDLQFNAYFLVTWDIIRYAKNREFFYIGRGSGANSIVAYCLEITDVDPLELDLYFERFLNPHRTSPPDFDIDFSWQDRDEIIDYIFKRYGCDHVCLLGSYTTFQSRAVLRELGKVFGLPKEEIDNLDGSSLQEDKIQKQIGYYGSLIKNYPDHLSIHAGGMLISEEPIHNYTATELPPKGFSTSQIDMFIAEKIGLFKLDILSQRGLGHIKETIELVKKNKNETIDIHDIEKFKKDSRLADKIRSADTIGCFYIESPAMRQLLKKLRCDDYLTLVAASSIIRPGVSQSGMMKQYIYRFHNPDKFEYLHPKMEELLKETYGVMVYQEDVIKVAHYFAGLDLGEADILRRAMSGKYRSHNRFNLIREKFFKNCKELGYADDLTKEVWRQMESFGGYSFSKAHSASFAVESYQSLFLKTYYPMEFMVAVINNFGGFYSRELYFHELKRTGAVIHLPCINQSEYLTSISAADVFMGFVHINGCQESFCSQVIEERTSNGKFLHLQDFIERLNPDIEQLNKLIRIGAFRFTGKNKKELLWEANFLQKKSKDHTVKNKLFVEAPVKFQLPDLSQHPLDDAMDEIELLGFPLCNVFDLVDSEPVNFVLAKNLDQHTGKIVSVLGYLVTTKELTTIHGEPMCFGTFLDAEGDWLDTVHFPPVLKICPVRTRGFYKMKGKVVEEFGVYTVEIEKCEKIGIKG